MIEAAFSEQLELKKNIFDLGQACPAHTLLVPNTSSCSVTEMALASGRPAQVIGAHSFNPVPIMKLLEVIVTDFTAPETKQALLTFAERLGKTTAVIKALLGLPPHDLALRSPSRRSEWSNKRSPSRTISTPVWSWVTASRCARCG